MKFDNIDMKMNIQDFKTLSSNCKQGLSKQCLYSNYSNKTLKFNKIDLNERASFPSNISYFLGKIDERLILTSTVHTSKDGASLEVVHAVEKDPKLSFEKLVFTGNVDECREIHNAIESSIAGLFFWFFFLNFNKYKHR